MNLIDLIEYLRKQAPETAVLHGFDSPHSYRGYYCELAFKPAENVTVASMLACAEKALGATYPGYKGGEFTMHEYTDCYLAEYGSCGEMISVQMLVAMISEAKFLQMKNALAGRDPAKLDALLEAVRFTKDQLERRFATITEPNPQGDLIKAYVDLKDRLAAFEGGAK